MTSKPVPNKTEGSRSPSASFPTRLAQMARRLLGAFKAWLFLACRLTQHIHCAPTRNKNNVLHCVMTTPFGFPGGQGIICAHKSGSSVHTDHLRTQGFCHLAHLYTHTHFWQGGGVGGGIGKHTRSSAPAQHCGGGGWWGGGGNGKHTRSSAPAQRCFHACGRVARRGGGGWGGGGMVSTCQPPNKHTRSRATDGVRYWGRWGLGRGGVGHTRSRALHPRLPPNKHTRSRAPAQRCTPDKHAHSRATHACRLNERLLRVGWAGVRLWGGWGGVGHTRSHTPAQHCAHACHLASAPAHA